MIKRGIMPQLAEVGKIKIGYKGKEVKSKNNKMFRPPKKLEYFVITSTERDAAGNLIKNADIMDKLGEKPTEIKIRLPFDSVDKNFFTQYQYYTASKKVCAGDGQEADRLILKSGKEKLPFPDAVKEIQVKEGERVKIVCDPESCPFYSSGKCKVSGILSAFLPDADDLGGVYKFRTHSYNSVSSILGALEYFKINTGGILQGLPLKLVLVRKTTNEHGMIMYATVVIDGMEIMKLREKALEEKQSRRALGTDIRLIEREAEQSGFFKDSDPPEEIEAEYYTNEEPAEQAGSTPEEVKEEIEKPDEEIEPEPAEDEDQKDLF